MLPMLFAPQNDQLVERKFEVPDPTADTFSRWAEALALAQGYWTLLCADERISEDFRTISAGSLQTLRAAPRRVAPRSQAPANLR